MKQSNVKQLIDVFASHLGCGIQHNGCPCNSCMHSTDEGIDFQHIVWLMLLAVRGDYDINDITPLIKDELQLKTKTK